MHSILLVDDHPIFLKGLIDLVREELPETELAAYTHPSAALEQAATQRYDIAVLDLDMPGMNGIALHNALKHLQPELKTIILTMHKENEIVRLIHSSDINGYVLKDDATDELIEALTTVLSGEDYASPVLASLAADEALDHFQQLTKTERLILKGISENKTSRMLADELFVSVKTIDNHRNNISRKLEIRGSNSLLKYALLHKRLL